MVSPDSPSASSGVTASAAIRSRVTGSRSCSRVRGHTLPWDPRRQYWINYGWLSEVMRSRSTTASYGPEARIQASRSSLPPGT